MGETTTTGFEAVGTAVGYMTEQVGSIMTTVTGNPILCLGIAMWVIGGAIALFQRLV